MGALATESSTLLAPITRPESFAGKLARELGQAGGGDIYAPSFGGMTEQQREAIPTLSPEDVNERYAPIGPDGKQIKITDHPLPEDVAQSVGKAKSDEIERNGVLSRFANAHSWPVTTAAGMAAFMLDPMNATSAFMPGVGEEAIAARLGASFLARTAARVASGAVAGAASQAPLEALRYDPNGENSLYDAFRNMAFAAAGNAVIGAGIGAVADWWRPPRVREVPGALPAPLPELTPEAEAESVGRSIMRADAATKAEAMRSGIAQLAEGREVNVLPILDSRQMAFITEAASLRETDAKLADVQGVVPVANAEAAETLARVRQVESQMAEARTVDERRALSHRRDELLANTTPEALQEQAAPAETARQIAAQRANIADRLAQIEQERVRIEAGAALSPLPSLANGQSMLYRNGYAQGLSDAEFRQFYDSIYNPERLAENVPHGTESGVQQVPRAEGQARAKIVPEVSRGGEPGIPAEGHGGAGGTEGAQAISGDPEIAAAEAALTPEARASLLPEEQAELAASEAGMSDAEKEAAAYAESAACIGGIPEETDGGA